MQLSIFAITIPPRTPWDLHQKRAPTGLLHPSFCILAFAPGGRGLLGKVSRGGYLSINDVCHFLNFHYNGKNWLLTTLWSLQFYTFLKKIIQT